MRNIIITGYDDLDLETGSLIIDCSGHAKMVEAFGPDARASAPLSFQKWVMENIYSPLGIAITTVLEKSVYVVCKNG